jgi:predicted SprT family Zn-dependent metalloprotease
MSTKENVLIDYSIRIACEKNRATNLIGQITYAFVSNLDKAIGMCYPRTKIIEIQKSLWDDAHEHEKRNIIIHEVCHVIVYCKYGVMDHGPEWRIAMRETGEIPYTNYIKGGCRL